MLFRFQQRHHNQKMALTLFWAKITAKRIWSLFRSSPAVIIVAILIFGIVVFAINQIDATLDFSIIASTVLGFICLSLFKSFKSHHVMPSLIRYSKSRLCNKNIYVKFFIKRAFVNNIWLLVFNVVAHNFLADTRYFIIISGASCFSMLLSFWVMYKKNEHLGKKVVMTSTKKRRVNPEVKSALYDYLAFDFSSLAVLCIALFFIGIVMFTQDVNVLDPYYDRFQVVFFVVITVIFSIGFLGILNSIPEINWRFQAIISPNDFKYHMKRTMFFLGGIYGWLLVLFVFIGGFVNPALMLKYLYCITILLFMIANIAFTITYMLKKFIISLLIIAFTIWVSTLSIIFLPISIIPVLATFIAAKNDYKEWFWV